MKNPDLTAALASGYAQAFPRTRLRRCERCTLLGSELCRVVRDEAHGQTRLPKFRHFERGQEIIVQGESPDFVGALRRGYVRQERLRIDGDHVLFGLACPGDIVGGIPGIAATCTSEAATDIEDCVFDRATVERLMLESPRFRKTCLKETQRQHHRLLGSAWRLNALDSRERIIAFLVDATGFMPTVPQTDGSIILTIEVSRRDWADLTNTVVETISRTLRYLAEEELVISVTPTKLRIRNLDRLAVLAGMAPTRRRGAQRDFQNHRTHLSASPESARRMTAVNAPKSNALKVGGAQSFMSGRTPGEDKRRSHHVEEKIRN